VKKKWYRPVLYRGACFFLWMLSVLPRTVVLVIARSGALCAFYCITREREKTLNNLKRVFGGSFTQQKIHRCARDVFKNLAVTACDFARFPRLSAADIKVLVRTSGFEKLSGHSNGGLIVTAHMGNWELLAAAMIINGYNGFVLGKRLRFDGYNDLVIRLRESQKVYTYYRDRSPKELLQRLKAGQLLGILPDQDIADVDGIFIDFFGIPAYTPTGPAKLALAAKVPIIMAFMLHEGDKYHLVIDSVIDTQLKDDETKPEAIERITRAWSGVIEKYIRQYPDQWAWMHNRWKTGRA
jgi:Kdo2-lipid IVA lauroyltransferase/acyltransferase